MNHLKYLRKVTVRFFFFFFFQTSPISRNKFEPLFINRDLMSAFLTWSLKSLGLRLIVVTCVNSRRLLPPLLTKRGVMRGRDPFCSGRKDTCINFVLDVFDTLQYQLRKINGIHNCLTNSQREALFALGTVRLNNPGRVKLLTWWWLGDPNLRTQRSLAWVQRRLFPC